MYLINKNKIKNYKLLSIEINKIIINNKEQTKQYNRRQYLKIKEQLGKKILCNCGSIIRTDYLRRHKKTNKHLNYEDNLK